MPRIRVHRFAHHRHSAAFSHGRRVRKCNLCFGLITIFFSHVHSPDGPTWVRFPWGKGRGTERLTSTCTSKTSDLREVYLYLTPQTLEVYLQYLSPDLQRSTLKGPLPFVHKCWLYSSETYTVLCTLQTNSLWGSNTLMRSQLVWTKRLTDFYRRSHGFTTVQIERILGAKTNQLQIYNLRLLHGQKICISSCHK
jgi:hypothetical protein